MTARSTRPERYFTLIVEERESGWAQQRRVDRIVLHRMLLEILRSPCAGFRLRGQGLWNEFCIKQWRTYAIVYVYDEADAYVDVLFVGRFATSTDPLRRLREYFASMGSRDSDHGHERLERLPCCRLSDAERDELLERFGGEEPTRLQP